MIAAGADGPPAGVLPRLRRDLLVSLVEEDTNAFPSAVIRDSVRGLYFKLTWPESGIFLAWQQASSMAGLHDEMLRSYGRTTTPEEVAQVVEFGFAHQLTEADQSGSWHRYAAIATAGKRSWLNAAMHNYLFFRIPLVRPERWLAALLPRLGLVYLRGFWLAVFAAGLAGLYLGARQWPAVVAAASDALDVHSLPLYAAAVLALKCIHELGHALTTVRYGCRVPSMGVAVMLGAPVLYTDTSDSWRLSRKSERLTIVFAGVAAEAIVAVAALLLWSILSDGPARQVCFALATASVALSLLVNLNPFMRFDGYFALSDYLGVPNLQSRAFELGTWRLRELLFDLGHDPPEVLPAGRERTLIRYAFATWVYRLFLFLGIAAVVYVVAGKAIGIVLALFEIVVFIANPIASELMTWWKLRSEIVRGRRVGWTGAALAVGLAAMLLPWLSTVGVPAVLVAGREEAIYLPFAARLTAIQVSEGQHVRAGETLFTADASDLSREQARAVLEQRALEFQAARLHASDEERELRAVIETRLARARERVAAIGRQMELLIIRAPFDGRIVDLDPEISSGIWLNEKQPLAHLIAEATAGARGMILEADLQRVVGGARAVFIADDAAMPRQELAVASIAPASDGRLSEPLLADSFGGSVVTGELNGEMVARHGVFEVAFVGLDRPVRQVVRGLARIDAAPISPATVLWRHVARVLVREQGF